jgi:hypothetical protein
VTRSTIVSLITVIAAVAVVVVWTWSGLPGPAAACAATDACDCEAVGAGPIRQPFNAWSSSALVAAGLWVMASAPRRRRGWDGALGAAIVASGLAAFAAHASATAWAYRADGAAIVLFTALLAGHEWAPDLDPLRAAALAVPAAALTGLGGAMGTNAAATVLGVAVLAAQWWRHRERRRGPAVVAGALLGGGAVIRLLGDSGGPWCVPDSPLQAHAVWHLLAAAGLTALVCYMRSGRTPNSPIRPIRPELRFLRLLSSLWHIGGTG